jgi:hypothetical protein
VSQLFAFDFFATTAHLSRILSCMGRGGDAADWTTDPKDVEILIRYFHAQRGRFGDGGNPDKTLLNDAAAHLGSLGPPKHG